MTNSKNKITMDMTGIEAMTALAEGNIGCINVLAQVARSAEKHDPDNAFGALGIFLQLDDLGVYGLRVWQLYKDVCGQKLGVMLGVLRAHQLGFIPTKNLLEHIGNDERRGKPFDDIDGLLKQVQETLPAFKVTVTP